MGFLFSFNLFVVIPMVLFYGYKLLKNFKSGYTWE